MHNHYEVSLVGTYVRTYFFDKVFRIIGAFDLRQKIGGLIVSVMGQKILLSRFNFGMLHRVVLTQP